MRESGAGYRKLAVWGRSHQLTLEIYRVSKAYPPEKRYALTSQVRRAASSIPMNLAEGATGASVGSYALAVDHALRSAGEVEYQLLLAHELGYLGGDAYARLEIEIQLIRRMLAKLYRTLKRVRAEGP